MKLHNGDCLIESDQIESGSVDLILTDLPYGTIKGLSLDAWGSSTTSWDSVIDTSKIYAIANRILRRNGKMILFAQEPFTTELINKALPNLPFNYRAIWEKDHFANCLSSKKAPVNYFEDILVFTKRHDFEELHPLRLYFKEVLSFIGLGKSAINKRLGHGKADHTFRCNSSQFALCTEATYLELIKAFDIDTMPTFKDFSKLVPIDNRFKTKFSSTFNLWEGNKIKSNIFKYSKDYGRFHPTQKPVLLLEDLIKTYSNEGNLVVDLTMGSGSTGVACLSTKRDFIGIEKDPDFFNIAKTRIQERTPN